ncbi:MAG: bacillithiol biosynthesis BshC [Bacteroidetes bacterium]|nr:bacillithiol biosynthesis BshC [Bacteroidota bacterium]MDA1242367.1 bacillithiol biosynthesis BshC [Bacteroidota bacterium]
MSSWPTSLPSGGDPAWSGWSKAPGKTSGPFLGEGLETEGLHPWRLKEAVVDVLSRQYTTAGLDLGVLEPLASHDARVVTVGHQLVLAGGAAFFHHKILSAIRVARRLSELWDIPVVPLFWMASEDHDLAEISKVYGCSDAHQWRPMDKEIPHPVGRRSLEGAEEVLAAWMKDGVHARDAEVILSAFQQAQQRNESWAGFTRRLIHAWYGKHGVVALDPDEAAFKRLCLPLWQAEMEGVGVAEALRNSGMDQGPAHVRDNQLFWLDSTRGRVGLVTDGGDGWRAGDLSWSRPSEGWSPWVREAAPNCSPGVLLRPLYQEWLLQSIAVVVGPGEWAYWHQLPAAFAAHGLTFPPLRMRDHALVVPALAREFGWKGELGFLHKEAWERWVLDVWEKPHQRHLEALGRGLERAVAEIAAWGVNESDQMAGASGALGASLDKAWIQWRKKFRNVLRGSRGAEWAAAVEAGLWLCAHNVPQDRFANWHVLAHTLGGVSAEVWSESWLKDVDDGLTPQVWWLEL